MRSWRRATVCAALLATTLWPGGPTRAATSTSDYARSLAAALTALRDAGRLTGAARAHALASARALLPPVMDVRLAGMRVPADLGAVRADLAAGHLSDAAARLGALRAALDAPAAQPAPAGRARLRALDGILTGPPFTAPPDLWSAIGAFVRRLVANSPLGAVIDAISRLLSAPRGSSSNPAGVAVAIVAGLIAAMALVFVANRAFGVFVPRAVAPDVARASVTRLDAAGAAAQAQTLAAAGEYRAAARLLFLSTLLALDEAGKLRVDRAAGNRDILRQARAVPRLAEALAPVVRGFELFWFGHVPVTREDYDRYRRLNERVLEAAR